MWNETILNIPKVSVEEPNFERYIKDMREAWIYSKKGITVTITVKK